MSKKFYYLLAPLFLLVFAFTLTGCDAYAGNYEPATKETLNAYHEKLEAVEEAEDDHATNLLANVSINSKAENGDKSSISGKTITDFSNDGYQLIYSEIKMLVKQSEQKLDFTASVKMWFDGQNKVYYIDYSIDGEANGQKTNTSGKKKFNSLVLAQAIPLIGSSLSLNQQTVELDIFDSYIDQLIETDLKNNENPQVSFAGDNKMKITSVDEKTGDNAYKTVSEYYLVINKDNTYSAKASVSSTTQKGTFETVAEVTPTSKKVTLPNEADFS